MTYRQRLSIYEREKNKLYHMNLTPREYDAKIRKLIKELKI